MRKSISLSTVMQIGRNKLAGRVGAIRPKFTVKDFVEGMANFSEYCAEEFIKHANNTFSKQGIDLKAISKATASKEFTSEKVLEGLIRDKAIVFVSSSEIVEGLSYEELFYIFEHGRKDKRITPIPFLRNAYTSFKPIYIKLLQDRLNKR